MKYVSQRDKLPVFHFLFFFLNIPNLKLIRIVFSQKLVSMSPKVPVRISKILKVAQKRLPMIRSFTKINYFSLMLVNSGVKMILTPFDKTKTITDNILFLYISQYNEQGVRCDIKLRQMSFDFLRHSTQKTHCTSYTMQAVQS